METGLTRRQIITSLIGLGLMYGGIFALFQYFDLADVRSTIESAGIWAPLVLIAAKASTIVIAPLGGSPLYPLAGALFGFWYGTLLLIIGDAIGGAIAFYISRMFGRQVAEKFIGNEKTFLSQALGMMGTTKGFLIARFCFMPIPELTAYGAGLTRLHFLPFIVIHASLGAIPALVFAKAGALIANGQWWVVPLMFVASLIGIPAGYFMFRSLVKHAA